MGPLAGIKIIEIKGIGPFHYAGQVLADLGAELIEKTALPKSFIEQQNNLQKWPELRIALISTFKSKTRDQWADIFEGSDACVAGIYDILEATHHPHNEARGTYIKINNVDQPAPAPRFSRSQCEVPKAPSEEGADSKQVLADFGYSADAIDDLNRAGVLT